VVFSNKDREIVIRAYCISHPALHSWMHRA
jgi:hypothetical protein